MGLNPKGGNSGRKKLPLLTGGPEPDPEPPPPPKAWTEENSWPIWYGELEVLVYERKLRDDRNRVVAFAVGLSTRLRGEDAWIEQLRVDCAHGFVHLDRYSCDGTKVKDPDSIPPECRENLDAALPWAINYMWEHAARMAG